MDGRTKPSAFSSKMDARGRILLPVHVRSELHLSAGDGVLLTEGESGFRLKTVAEEVREAQEYVARLVAPGVSHVDELLHGRREEAARDSRE